MIETDLTETVLTDIAAWTHELAEDIGERNGRTDETYAGLQRAAHLIASTGEDLGYRVRRRQYLTHGRAFENVQLEALGSDRQKPMLLVGAHYDSAAHSPGANDNATGVACLLAVARLLAGSQLKRTLRFVAFTNEEAPYAGTPSMGSDVYVRECDGFGERFAGFVSLDSLCPPSRRAPKKMSRMFVMSSVRSREFATSFSTLLNEHPLLDARTLTLPWLVPALRDSDVAPFAARGVPAVLLTGAGRLTYIHSHRPTDLCEKIGIAELADLSLSIARAVRRMCS